MTHPHRPGALPQQDVGDAQSCHFSDAQTGLQMQALKKAGCTKIFREKVNKGEARDRNFANQRYRASGLTLVTAAIALWNTVYLERAIQALQDHGQTVDKNLLRHLSPLGWEHINLTGDYVWRQNHKA